jgi:hypothetical protein
MTPDEAVRILKKTSKPVLNKIVSNLASVVPNSQSIQETFGVFRGRKNPYKIYIGPRYGRGTKGANLAHLFEFGTQPRKRRSINKEGKVVEVSTGQINKTPFMRPAWLATKDQFVIDTEKEIERIIRQKFRKQGFK